MSWFLGFGFDFFGGLCFGGCALGWTGLVSEEDGWMEGRCVWRGEERRGGGEEERREGGECGYDIDVYI
jgi:hypothetical protein